MSLSPYGLDRWLDEEIARAHYRHARRHGYVVLAFVVLVTSYLAYAAVTQKLPTSRPPSVGVGNTCTGADKSVACVSEGGATGAVAACRRAQSASGRFRVGEGGDVCDRPRESETRSLASSAVVCIGVPAEASKSTAHDDEQQLRKNAGTPFNSAGRLAVGCAREPALGV